MLMSVNTALVTAQSGLERIRNEPMPIHYEMFIRGMAWFFADHGLQPPGCGPAHPSPAS